MDKNSEIYLPLRELAREAVKEMITDFQRSIWLDKVNSVDGWWRDEA